MRKPDEVALFNLLRAEIDSLNADTFVDAFPCEIIGDRLGIPRKRVYSLLDKWDRNRWWEFGVSLRSGWFTPNAPLSIQP